MDDVGQFQADVEAEIPEVCLLPLLNFTCTRPAIDKTERSPPELILCFHQTEHHGRQTRYGPL